MSKKGYEMGSGNVFKDIGVPNAEEHFVKAQLVFKIDTIIKKRGLKQVEAADLFGVRQPDISKMLRVTSDNFPSNGFYAFLSRSIRMLRSSSSLTVTEKTRRRCMSYEVSTGAGMNWATKTDRSRL